MTKGDSVKAQDELVERVNIETSLESCTETEASLCSENTSIINKLKRRARVA